MDEKNKQVVCKLLDLLRDLDSKSMDLIFEIFPGDGLPGEEHRIALEYQAKEIGLRFLRLHGLEAAYLHEEVWKLMECIMDISGIADSEAERETFHDMLIYLAMDDEDDYPVNKQKVVEALAKRKAIDINSADSSGYQT